LDPTDEENIDEFSADSPAQSSSSSTSSSHSSTKWKRLSPQKRMKVALAYLRHGRLSPIDLLAHILDTRKSENDRHRTALYREGGRLGEILNMVMNDVRGKERLDIWMEGHAIDLTCAIVDREMDVVKKRLSMKLEDVSPDYIAKWTVETTAGAAAQQSAPVLYRLLVRAAQTDTAKAKNRNKKPDTARNLMHWHHPFVF
jgi:hypothetical protein